MKRGRRRLHQRVERENGSNSSDSDVIIVSGPEDTKESSQDGAWECPMCTFLNGNAEASRCEVCESARPGLPRKAKKLTQWLSQPTEKKHLTQTLLARQSQPIEVIDSSDSDTAASIASSAAYSDRIELQNGRSNGKVSAVNTGLWADTYAPKTVDELCVNKKKVQEIQEWLVQNASLTSRYPQKRLLFLCGPPGAGKSTAVRCIARQLGLLVKEWEDNSSAGKMNYERMMREEFWTPQVNGMDDFSDFIRRSSAYAALPVATSRIPSSTSRKRKLPSSQAGYDVSRRTTGHAGQLILIESWPQSWSKDPSQHDEKLQQIYQYVIDPAGGCRYPVVCIYSDVQGGKIDLDHLSRKFSREVMHSPLTSVINVNAVTAAQLKKHLTRVAGHESCVFQSADIQRVIDSSNGDIRHALHMLQLLQGPRMSKKKSATTGSSMMSKNLGGSDLNPSSSMENAARDPFLSDFHLVGKLLHGKAIQSKISAELASEVDYSEIFDASTMSLDRALGLVHENSVAYFTQVEDLSGALELMSLCEEIVAESYKGVNTSGAFKRSRDVAEAILMRTIAVTNENPAPKAFRPITRPRTYTTKQRIVSRREDMFAATRGGELGLQYACTGDVFAFEVEPFLTIMDKAGGPAARQLRGASFALNKLSVQEKVDDEIENSDDEW